MELTPDEVKAQIHVHLEQIAAILGELRDSLDCEYVEFSCKLHSGGRITTAQHNIAVKETAPQVRRMIAEAQRSAGQ